MLTFIRRIIYSRVGVFVTLGVLVVIALAFAAGDITGLRGNKQGAVLAGDAIATVGDEKVTSAEIRQRAGTALDAYRQQQPGLDMASFVNGGGLQQVLDRTINGLALQQFANSIGMAMSPKAVDGEIASIPAFQGVDGKFSQKTYEAILQQQRLSDAQLKADIVRDSLARQLLAPTMGAAQMPAKIALPYASLLLEKRSGSVGMIPTGAVNVGAAPTDAEIAAYYSRNRGRYTVPERRVARYAVIRAADIAAKSAPTDAEIAAAYKQNAKRYAATEKRSITQVVVADQASANALAAKVKGGTPVAAAARAAGLEPGVFTGLEKEALAQQTAPAIANAAFGAAKGAVLGPIRAPLGWVVLHVDNIEAVPAKSLDQAKAELTTELTKLKTTEAMGRLHDSLDDATAKSSTFDEIVADAKLQPQQTPPLLGNGLNPDQPATQPDPVIARVVAAAFTAEPGDSPQLVQIDQDGSFAVVAVGQVVPAAPRPLAQIRAKVLQDIGNDRAMKAARAAAVAVVAKVTKGMSLAQALSETGLKLPPVEQKSFSRAQLAAQGKQLPTWVSLMFSMRSKSAKLLEAPGRTGWMVVTVDSIENGNAAGNAGLIAQTRQGLGSVSGREFAEQFTSAVRQHVGVKRNEGAIAALRAELSGNAGAGAGNQ